MTHCNKNQDICILDLLLIVYVLVFVLELHNADVSFCSCFFPLFCVLICVLFFVQATSFNERSASLVAFQVL